MTDNSFEKMNIKGTDFTERKEAGEKIIEICKSMTNPEPLEIGEYKGFKIILSFDTMDRKFYASMKNNLSYKTLKDGEVLIEKIDINKIK